MQQDIIQEQVHQVAQFAQQGHTQKVQETHRVQHAQEAWQVLQEVIKRQIVKYHVMLENIWQLVLVYVVLAQQVSIAQIHKHIIYWI